MKSKYFFVVGFYLISIYFISHAEWGIAPSFAADSSSDLKLKKLQQRAGEIAADNEKFDSLVQDLLHGGPGRVDPRRPAQRERTPTLNSAYWPQLKAYLPVDESSGKRPSLPRNCSVTACDGCEVENLWIEPRWRIGVELSIQRLTLTPHDPKISPIHFSDVNFKTYLNPENRKNAFGRFMAFVFRARSKSR